MTTPKRRPSPGDPQLRALLFLLVGGALLYASFDRGGSRTEIEKSVTRATQADEAAAAGTTILPTQQHRMELVAHPGATIAITATTAVMVENLASPGRFTCNVGLSVYNSAGQAIEDLEFGVDYTGGGASGGSAHRVEVAPLSEQNITPVPAVPGRCDGLSGSVHVYRCSFLDGSDCASLVVVRPAGTFALKRAS